MITDVGAILEHITREFEHERPVALCAIVATRGSTPQPAGTIVCVDQNGEMTGSLGGGCVEADVRLRAKQVLLTGQDKLLEFVLDNECAMDEGMVCGGKMDVAVCTFTKTRQAQMLQEVLENLRNGRYGCLSLCLQQSDKPVEYRLALEPRPKLVIVGGGHICKQLAHLVVPLGFDVSVVDDRSDFANTRRFPPPMKVTAGEIGHTLSHWPIDGNTYIVIVTRGHRHDERALAAVLNSPAKYIGMIGSRRKIGLIFRELIQEGHEKDRLDRVHAPIGIDIHAVTAEEIAISIAAQLVSIRRQEHRKIVEGPFHVTG